MKKVSARAYWLDYLRSFVTLLVLAHHAALAYPTFAIFDKAHYIHSTAPVVDSDRWWVMDIFIGFNDLFFMPLMFLISGLFVYKGLCKKGTKAYVTDRIIRLGIPFLVAQVLLIPLAYMPSFYLATDSTNFSEFLKDYLTHQQWPVGPPWFIWLLLSFDGVAAMIFNMRPAFYTTSGKWLASMSRFPASLSAAIYGMAALSLIPLSLYVGQYTWVGRLGPFDFQLNRLLLYGLFFFLGSCLGAIHWQDYLFKQNKLFGKNWLFWLTLSIACYGLVVMVSRFGYEQVTKGNLTAMQGFFLYDLVFVASCLLSTGACLSIFKQKITGPLNGWNSLSENAYGIYLVHYGFVTWLQFLLLHMQVPVFVKFVCVFAVALALSWLTIHLSRRHAVIARIL